MVTLFSVLGISYAHWNNGVQIYGTVSTGNLDVVFVDSGDNSHLSISDGGKTLGLNITGVVPNDSPITIPFKMRNVGSIPAKLQMDSRDAGGAVHAQVRVDDRVVVPQETCEGTIEVRVNGSADELEEYTFSFELRYQQSLGASR